MARRATSVSDTGERIVDAALALAAERKWSRIRLADIAERAGVSLAEMRATFAGKREILAAFSARIDRVVLESIDPEIADEPPRERLFDVMMARLDALRPHRAAVRSITSALERDPSQLLACNATAHRSMGWMLEAAGIDASGRSGALRAQGLAVAFARTLRVWLDDEDEGLARTMVALDRRLREGETCLRRVDMACGLARAMRSILREGPPRRRRAAPPAGMEAEGGAGI